jgi:hypothetical protein
MLSSLPSPCPFNYVLALPMLALLEQAILGEYTAFLEDSWSTHQERKKRNMLEDSQKQCARNQGKQLKEEKGQRRDNATKKWLDRGPTTHRRL